MSQSQRPTRRRGPLLSDEAKKAIQEKKEKEETSPNQSETIHEASKTTTTKRKVKPVNRPKDTTSTSNSTELEKLKKKSSFNETHTRITTYLENEVSAKVKKLKEEMNIPVKELINTALKEFFEKHNL